MTRPILVLGGAGYIGSHFCKLAAANGYLPVAYDNLSAGVADAVRWGPLERGEVGDAGRLDAVFAAHRPLAVVHFAALANVGEATLRPDLCYRTNVAGTLAVIEAMGRHGVRSLLFSSTCATYGDPQFLPMTEAHPQLPINSYGWSKLMAERMLLDFRASLGLRPTLLRYFNAAGADPDGELRERHEPETHLIPLILEAAAGKRPHIKIFGRDYPTPDGTCIRDYVHVQDLARAHLLALDRLVAGFDPGIYNLGAGLGHSVLEVVEAVRRVTGRPVLAEDHPRRPGDPPVLVADSAHAQAELRWTPTLSDLDTQVAHAWNSMSINKGHENAI